jgi:cytochrome c oxidase subunit 4
MEHLSSAPRVYYVVYAVLLALLLLTVLAAQLDWGIWGALIALTIAVVKAVLVMLYFMHLRYSSRLIWLYASAGVVWLGILFVLTMSDYISRGWLTG